jgi:site-specific recombinase XerD
VSAPQPQIDRDACGIDGSPACNVYVCASAAGSDFGKQPQRRVRARDRMAEWEQVDLRAGRLQVIRRKGSDDSVQPLCGSEIRALRRVKREQEPGSRYVFLTERKAPMTANGFFKMLGRAAESVGMNGIHPHLLRHGTGFKLVNQGVDTRTLAAYLGHRQIANTARYTKMDARRFDGFWQD